jgi:multidrug resistance efflux pump
MHPNAILDLADCTEFRQTLQARPPRIVHGTVFLAVALLGSATLWAALTRADLVVRLTGRVRPASTPKRVFNAGRGEVLSATAGSRVRAVNFHEGDAVHRGDVLLTLETERLDNDIARRRRTLQTSEEELTRLEQLETIQAGQCQTAREKANAELAQALEEVKQARERQGTEIRLALVEWNTAREEEERTRRLAATHAASEQERSRARAGLLEAKVKLDRARLPVDETRVAILRQALTLAEKDCRMKREELALKRRLKQGEIESARLELAGLEAERKQAVLRAPVDGVVTAGDIKVGDLLEAGKPVVELAEENGFRFEALAPSEEVGHLHVGMPARLKLDAYDYQKYGTLEGTVAYIAPDSGVPEGQHGAYYTVRIDLTGNHVGQGTLHGRVKLGMSGEVEIVTEQESLLRLLVKCLRRTISLG